MGDFDLTYGEIVLQTETGGVLHPNDQAFATERLSFSVGVTNPAPSETGLLTVSWWLNGAEHGGETHMGAKPNDTVWLQWWSPPMQQGQNSLTVRVEPEDTLTFNAGERTTQFTVVAHPHRDAMPEGGEAYHEGWTQADVHIRIDNFLGDWLTTGDAVVQFTGPGGESQGIQSRVEDGQVTFHQAWVPTVGGEVRLWITLPHGNVNQLHGQTEVGEVHNKVVNMAFTQDHTKETKTHSEAKTVSDTLGGEANYGWDFGITKAGVKVSYSHMESSTDTDSTQYDVLYAQPTLHSRTDAVPGQR